jgi:hypothetical protein
VISADVTIGSAGASGVLFAHDQPGVPGGGRHASTAASTVLWK